MAFISPSAKIGAHVYIGAFAYIGENAVIGDETQIYPHSYIGDNVKVGNETLVYSGVNVYHDCHIGNKCILHSGCVIGADGFGFAPSASGYEKIPQIGIVELEDDVEVGANTCIDRATMGHTVIHKGVKLDNLVQIAHNGDIGSYTVMAAQVGVAGSTKIGQWCMFGGQAGISGHSTIGDKTTIGPQSGTSSSVKGNLVLMGSPAIEAKTWMKASYVFKQLPDMFTEMNAMRKEIEELKKKLNK